MFYICASTYWNFDISIRRKKLRRARFLVLIAHSPKNPGSNPSGFGLWVVNSVGTFPHLFLVGQKHMAKPRPEKKPTQNPWLPFQSHSHYFFFASLLPTAAHIWIYDEHSTLFVYMGFPRETFGLLRMWLPIPGQQTPPQQLQVVANNGYKMLRQEKGLEVFQGSTYWNSPSWSRFKFHVRWVGLGWLGRNC